jgi:hypothetical protein
MKNEKATDGQKMFLLDDHEWDQALSLGAWRSLRLGYPETRELERAMLRFAQSHKNQFVLALYLATKVAKSWSVVTLISSPYGWQRVQIERVRCSTCGAVQSIANPTVTDLYLGVADWHQEVRRAMASGSVGCVRCGAQLPRFAVWSEVYLDE